MRVRRAHGGVLLALCSGCLPEVEPPWLVDEMTVATVTTRVVGLGPLAPERGSFVWPAPLVDALPGDVVELEAIVLDADGELVGEESQPRWLLCGIDSGQCPPGSSGRRPAACPEFPETPVADTCVIGDGAKAYLGIGPLRDDPRYASFFNSQYMVVAAGTPGTSTGEACLDRLQGDSGVDNPLWDCRFTELSVPLGPIAPLLDAAEEAGFELGEDVMTLPEEVRTEEPNRAPVVESIRIDRPERGDALVYGAEPIDLRAGELVGITAIVDPASVQLYYGFADDPLLVDEYMESMYGTWFSAELLEDVSSGEGWPLFRHFRMPSSGRVRHIVVVEDGRGARSWETVDLEVKP